MNGLRIDPLGEGAFRLSGELDFDNVPGAFEEGARLFASAPALVLDLQGVSRSDSSGLALLIEWLRLAREQQKPIRIKNIPQQMRALITASGLDAVLPLG